MQKRDWIRLCACADTDVRGCGKQAGGAEPALWARGHSRHGGSSCSVRRRGSAFDRRGGERTAAAGGLYSSLLVCENVTAYVCLTGNLRSDIAFAALRNDAPVARGRPVAGPAARRHFGVGQRQLAHGRAPARPGRRHRAGAVPAGRVDGPRRLGSYGLGGLGGFGRGRGTDAPVRFFFFYVGGVSTAFLPPVPASPVPAARNALEHVLAARSAMQAFSLLDDTVTRPPPLYVPHPPSVLPIDPSTVPNAMDGALFDNEVRPGVRHSGRFPVLVFTTDHRAFSTIPQLAVLLNEATRFKGQRTMHSGRDELYVSYLHDLNENEQRTRTASIRCDQHKCVGSPDLVIPTLQDRLTMLGFALGFGAWVWRLGLAHRLGPSRCARDLRSFTSRFGTDLSS